MADVFSKLKRSEVMSRIRSRGNRDTELALAKLLRAHRITGWRRHIQVRIVERGTRNGPSPRPTPQKRVNSRQPSPGFATLSRSRRRGHRREKEFRTPHSALRVFAVRPDFVFPKSRTAIFVDGCFWHGCPKHATKPKNNRAFWRRKLAANKQRDALVSRTLCRAGWRVLRVWECDLARRPGVCLGRIQRARSWRRAAGISRPVSA
ncbi:MAG TPA: very short patch repair endonuclease [Verrucomicrobiota bacterium]|nr:very short patch repair endonuclease [Verrucomicrobiota bacterium]HNT13860.1 very short patch repair endonuclease [Verrucomicrobiota bacterium]